ncbi:MAG: flavin reductase family protein [Calditrichae bacterium]|nr:flavin reductase family protein [Calditrichia bacterium]
MVINPKDQKYNENYKLMIGSILPRPIAFVSTVSTEGHFNLAPFSFFTGVTSDPPTVLFCPTRQPNEGQPKDTLINIRETGEFVINIVTEDISEPMNDCATNFPYGVDEFKESGLTAVPAHVVKAPMVKESPIHFECKLNQIIEIGEAKPGGGFIVIGEIVLFHIADDLYKNGRIDIDGLKPVGRLAGAEYTKIGERFSLVRKTYIKK